MCVCVEGGRGGSGGRGGEAGGGGGGEGAGARAWGRVVPIK